MLCSYTHLHTQYGYYLYYLPSRRKIPYRRRNTGFSLMIPSLCFCLCVHRLDIWFAYSPSEQHQEWPPLHHHQHQCEPVHGYPATDSGNKLHLPWPPRLLRSHEGRGDSGHHRPITDTTSGSLQRDLTISFLGVWFFGLPPVIGSRFWCKPRWGNLLILN